MVEVYYGLGSLASSGAVLFQVHHQLCADFPTRVSYLGETSSHVIRVFINSRCQPTDILSRAGFTADRYKPELQSIEMLVGWLMPLMVCGLLYLT